jgi:hypothetical protein
MIATSHYDFTICTEYKEQKEEAFGGKYKEIYFQFVINNKRRLYGKIMLKCILCKWVENVCSGLICLRIGTGDRLLRTQ